VVTWDTRQDRFERGAWFHGRIYHRRSDLSPDGTKLIYFANKFTGRSIKDPEYTYAWTAVSKVPYLTALALWPKGDCWWGGGLFRDNYTVFLNHRPDEAKAHPQHRPNRLRVIPNPKAHGEDDPLYSERLTRDGWSVEQEWRTERQGWNFRTLQPELRVRAQPEGRLSIAMERSISGLRYREGFRVLDANRSELQALHGADWADWDQGGRLVFLRGGAVWVAETLRSRLADPVMVIDLAADTPQPRATPAWAQSW
jgi:hypothetical protein